MNLGDVERTFEATVHRCSPTELSPYHKPLLTNIHNLRHHRLHSLFSNS
uniref:Uncharacterized protein n=1 Tax=Nelumbo nucifera TaxID=4432 RepID=A0A822YWH6_NELNU|nr:TPA_asm: hypothetical protein HUJ06_007538 [Nelumbo nucifera]